MIVVKGSNDDSHFGPAKHFTYNTHTLLRLCFWYGLKGYKTYYI
jgi:hypothetical protein